MPDIERPPCFTCKAASLVGINVPIDPFRWSNKMKRIPFGRSSHIVRTSIKSSEDQQPKVLRGNVYIYEFLLVYHVPQVGPPFQSSPWKHSHGFSNTGTQTEDYSLSEKDNAEYVARQVRGKILSPWRDAEYANTMPGKHAAFNAPYHRMGSTAIPKTRGSCG